MTTLSQLHAWFAPEAKPCGPNEPILRSSEQPSVAAAYATGQAAYLRPGCEWVWGWVGPFSGPNALVLNQAFRSGWDHERFAAYEHREALRAESRRAGTES